MKSTEERLTALEKALDPQTLRNALERTWDPRGGEPRVIDADGRTLDYQGAIQFLNATATVDPVAQRVIVTPSGGGGGGLAGTFSDDAVTSDAERVKFTAESGPAVNHLVLDTLTIGTMRMGVLVTAEDAAAANAFGALIMQADDTANAGAAIVQASGSSQGKAQAQALSGTQSAGSLSVATPAGANSEVSSDSTADLAVAATLRATTTTGGAGTGTSGATSSVVAATEQGQATTSLAASSSGGQANVVTQSDGTGFGFVDAQVNALSARVLDNLSRSNFAQTATDGTSTAAIRQVIRGPFVVALTPLAAGAVVTFPVANVWAAAATDPSKGLFGAMQGAPGVERAVWSWAIDIDPTEPDITVRNIGPASVTPTLVFFSACDA